MATLASAVVVNVQVLHPAGGGTMALTEGGLSAGIDYYLREGRFGERGEIEREPTEADLALEAGKAGRAYVPDIVDYGARAGRFEGRNPEIPMEPGETSGGAWDRSGIADPEAVKREIIASGSSVVRAVVSVPREWAPVLGLTTKSAWQDLVRGCWDDAMGRWGDFPPEDRRWVAFYHTDNAVSLHVHILSWDASGRMLKVADLSRHFFRNFRETPTFLAA